MRDALKPSKMLKVSKDGLKVKRRIPFRKEYIDVHQQDKCMIYVENFPSNLDHEKLASIFKRAGKIRHVSLPRFPDSKKPKGFAFIEFSTEVETTKAIDMFNNTVPQELVDIGDPGYIVYDDDIKPFKVMSKEEWLRQKEEISAIKTELQSLNL